MHPIFDFSTKEGILRGLEVYFLTLGVTTTYFPLHVLFCLFKIRFNALKSS